VQELNTATHDLPPAEQDYPLLAAVWPPLINPKGTL
jgi:hypothetical protein